MTTSQDVSHRLQFIERDECASLQTYRRLAERIADPTTGMVLAMLARDAEHVRTLLRRICAGALDVVGSANSVAVNGGPGITEINALSRTADMRARHLRELACSERSLDHAALAMLLEAIAAHSDKDARLLQELARHLEVRHKDQTSSSRLVLGPRQPRSSAQPTRFWAAVRGRHACRSNARTRNRVNGKAYPVG